MMEKIVSTSLGVIVERRRVDHPWADEQYRVAATVPGAAAVDSWTLLPSEDGATRWHAATVPLTLHAKDTPSLKYNLEAPRPSLWVVLRPAEGERPYDVRLATVSPFEAEAYMQSGEEIVEALPMPPEIHSLVSAFVATHHVEEPFFKRKRTKAVSDAPQFGKEPIFGSGRR